MDKMEAYFKNSGCEYVYLDVFWPNTWAIDFYRKLGYQDRMLTMIKPIL